MIDIVQEPVLRPVVGLWAKAVEFIPNIPGVLLLLRLGYVVARLIGKLVS